MDFGLQLPSGGATGDSQLRHYREILERLPSDFTTVWVNDHLQFGTDEQLEGWTLLTFLAGAYPRFRYGHLVLAQSYRNPGLLGKMAATLQELTGGKFILGLGAGWHGEEYRSYGYDFPRPGVRVAQLGEAITLIRTLWTESPATFRGDYFSIERAVCEPRPDPPIPILVGTSGNKGLRIAAELADMWNWDGPLDPTFRAPLERLRAHCAALGRPEGDLTLTAGIEVSLPEDPSAWFPWVDVPAGDRVYRLGPTPADVAREVRLLAREGVSHFQVAFDTVNSLDRFVVEVVPTLRI